MTSPESSFIPDIEEAHGRAILVRRTTEESAAVIDEVLAPALKLLADEVPLAQLERLANQPLDSSLSSTQRNDVFFAQIAIAFHNKPRLLEQIKADPQHPLFLQAVDFMLDRIEKQKPEQYALLLELSNQKAETTADTMYKLEELIAKSKEKLDKFDPQTIQRLELTIEQQLEQVHKICILLGVKNAPLYFRTLAHQSTILNLPQSTGEELDILLTLQEIATLENRVRVLEPWKEITSSSM